MDPGSFLLGGAGAAFAIIGFIKSKDQMRNGFVASHMVYAIGLTKDRKQLDDLLEVRNKLVDAWEKLSRSAV